MVSTQMVVMVLLVCGVFSSRIPTINVFDLMSKDVFESLLQETKKRLELLDKMQMSNGPAAQGLRRQVFRLQRYLEKERSEPNY